MKTIKISPMTTIKRCSLLLFAWLLAVAVSAQKRQELPTKYSKNKSAVITLTNGRQVKSPDTNIFLKDASLLYFQNGEAKQARMDIIACVEFDDRKYINIENQLAYFVDSIKGNSLYCVEVIDMKAYKQGIVNNRTFTHIDLSSERLETYADTFYDAEDFQYPMASLSVSTTATCGLFSTSPVIACSRRPSAIPTSVGATPNAR